MTQPPQGPPPDGPYPAGAQYPPPPYPLGQAPIPPREPRRSSPVIAPVLAFAALVLVAAASVFLVNYLSTTIDTASASESPTPAATAEAIAAVVDEPTEAPATEEPDDTAEPVDTEPPAEVATEEPEPETTAEPILVVPPSDERADIAGSLLFTRLGGDIWAASDTTMKSLTNSSSTKADSSPTWSPDGKHIYFIRSTKREMKDGRARYDGKYTLYPTDLMRMKADGSDKKTIYDAMIRDSRGQWFSTVLQPSVSPAGNNVAVVSDGNDGSNAEVTVHVVNSANGRMRRVDTPTESRFGHNDPDFSPDGTKIAFTYNRAAGTESDPKVGVFTCQTKSNCTNGKERYLKAGYASPSWSPGGNLLAVETTDGTGRDIAIITARAGHERVQLTTDGDSFAPEFSPNGDQIAYLRRDGLGIDVRVMTLEIDDKGKISLIDDRAVTSDGKVDGESGLSWYIPKGQLTSSAAAQAASEAEVAGDTDETEATTEPDSDALDEAPPPPPGS
jgi:hypothetical protein